ncbi:L-fuculokinase [Caldicellulosiruptoraceae bacterium PP1]
MSLLGIDVGSTNIKAGLFDINGNLLCVSSRFTPTHIDKDGFYYINPDKVTSIIIELLNDISQKGYNITSIGITSMAEAGLLFDVKNNRPATPIIPWYDKSCIEYVNNFISRYDTEKRFYETGVYPSFKYGIFKIQWLIDKYGLDVKNLIWLNVADLVALFFTNKAFTDYSLATRTYAFNIVKKQWDSNLLTELKIQNIFPECDWAGLITYKIKEDFNNYGISKNAKVAIAGHDHLCASIAVGADDLKTVLDSIGTAETLVGIRENTPLNKNDRESGMSFGCHILKDKLYWMGGLSSSGGSIEWFRKKFLNGVDYDKLIELLINEDKPTGILYFPYLNGSGAPKPNINTKAVFIGIDSETSESRLLKAIIEGTNYEIKWIYEMVEKYINSSIENIVAVGGGTKNKYWMQTKADILNKKVITFKVADITLLGAAIIGGISNNVYKDLKDAKQTVSNVIDEIYYPNNEYINEYDRYFAEYINLQNSLRSYYDRINNCGVD